MWIAVIPLIFFTAQDARAQDAEPDIKSPPSANPTFDFTGIEMFWHIVDILQLDKEPDPALWDQVLTTPGYMALTASEFETDFFVKNFRLAYMPSLAAERQNALADPATKRYLQHYTEVLQRRDDLAEHQGRLTSRSILTEALERTRSYLPPGAPQGIPPVAFVIFARDGRGYDPIVMDLMASMEWDLEAFLAHDCHHWYRNRMRKFRLEDLAPEDALLVHTLDQMQAEGIADQIDKAAWFDPKIYDALPAEWQAYADRFFVAVDGTPELLVKLDSLIRGMSTADADEQIATGEAVAELVPMSGHPTGYYMARLIREELGDGALTEDGTNAFAFMRRYDEAARKAGSDAPVLSAETLAYLGALEDKYLEVGKP
jgi:hypothetical protein